MMNEAEVLLQSEGWDLPLLLYKDSGYTYMSYLIHIPQSSEGFQRSLKSIRQSTPIALEPRDEKLTGHHQPQVSVHLYSWNHLLESHR